MKRKIACMLLILVLLFTCSSCGSKYVNRTYSLGSKKSYIKPVKEEKSPEDQQIIDQYYEEMITLYPQFGTIPREMLSESIHRGSDDLIISFHFILGGLYTGCGCTFDSSSKQPEGYWTVNENEFSQYYQCGISEKTMKKIRSIMYKQISKYVKARHLEKTDFQKNTTFVWKVINGKTYLSCEHIADVTDSTTRHYGCGSHAHINERVRVELSNKSVKIKVYPANGT